MAVLLKLLGGLSKLSAYMAWVAALLGHVTTIVAILMTFFVMLSSTMRYFVGAPFFFTEELVGLLFASMSFLVLPRLLCDNRHIKIDIVTRLLPKSAQLVSDIFANLVLLAFVVWLAVEGVRFALQSKRFGAKSDVADITLFPWHAIIPISMTLLGVVAFLKLATTLVDAVQRRSEGVR